MKQSQGPLRTAIFNRISPALNIPVYSTTPKDAQYPHCQIGTIIPIPFGGKSCPGQQLTVIIDFWYHHTQTDEDIDTVFDLASQAITDVDSIDSTGNPAYSPLAVVGFDTVNQLLLGGLDVPNTDDTIKHKQLTVEVWVMEAKNV